MRTTEYLDAARVRHGLSSDYQLAKLLGWRPNKISNYRKGISGFGDAECVDIAQFLDLDPAEVLANIYAERTRCPAARAALSRAASLIRRHGLALFLAALVFGPSLMPAPARSSVPAVGAASLPLNVYYVKRVSSFVALAMCQVSRLLNSLFDTLFPPSFPMGGC